MDDDTTLPVTLAEDDDFIAIHDGVFYNLVSKPPKHKTHRLQCTQRLVEVKVNDKDLRWCLAVWLQDTVGIRDGFVIDDRVTWAIRAFNKEMMDLHG